MKKYLVFTIALSALAALGAYFTVRELANALEDESNGLFTEEYDF